MTENQPMIENNRRDADHERHRSYYEKAWQRELSLFTHYSTVRMACLTFLIPLGGLMITQHKPMTGSLLILAAYGLNLFFGVRMALKRWLAHMNIDLWLKMGPENSRYDDYREKSFPTTFGALAKWLCCGGPLAVNPRSAPAWKKEWNNIVRRARKTEFFIQSAALAGVAALLSFLHVIEPVKTCLGN